MNTLRIATLGVALIASSAYAATTTSITITPTSPGWAVGSNPAGIAGDFAPGWNSGSIGATPTGKEDIYFTPAQLFGRDVQLSEIASMSFWTKKDGTHVASPSDWFQNIYTASSSPTAGWYSYRIGSEPYFSGSLSETAGDWNQWDSDPGNNRLRFFVSGQNGVSTGYFGSYTDPFWPDFLAANPNAAGLNVLYFSLQTASAGAGTLLSQLDGYTITLNNGDVANVNFEDNAGRVPDAGSTAAFLGLALGGLFSVRRWFNI